MKRYKRFLSLLAVIVMFICFLQVYTLTTFATDADTSWYSSSSTSFTLYDAADLAGLASLVNAGNDFSGKTITLGNSIDLNNEEWTPIGTFYMQFNGSFDGNNKKINNLTISSSLTYVGLFGVIGESSTIKNLTVSGSLNSEYYGGAIGGIVARNYGMVSDCVYSGTVSGSGRTAAGGIVGYNNKPSGMVTNCINTGTVSKASYVGGIVGFNYGGTLSNNYYLSDTADTATGQTAKTLTDFASGEVTYLLTGGVTDGTQAWYQTLGTDSYPVLDSTHGTVYYTTSCNDSSTYYYSNSSVSHVGGSYDSNGFCTRCGSGYQPAELNNSGIYEISNPGQLFWFASLVNGDTTQDGITAAVSNASAVLTSDIDLSVITLTHTSTEWTPIGSESAPFSGTFDGGSYTVSGMSITTAADYAGLFGYVTGTVKNMTVDGS
ncbi:MAG: hypothetical protein LUC92_00830, partial [Clostridiales bacterium]|nr:hypothetical protein [Clostridiales bacterium]